MKISLNWINEYVDIQDYKTKAQDLGALLTRAGLEVEELHDQAQSLNHVVVGKILKKDKHPNADRLTLCQVQVSPSETLQIVCGAQNHKEGDHVAVAKVGAILPGDFKIIKSKIRSVESCGMLCSYKELGMNLPSDGIVILDSKTEVGRPIAELFQQNDVTLELKVTPNRADCLSHYGLAREIACLLGRPLKSVDSSSAREDFVTPQEIVIQDQNLCGRYAGCLIQGLSPVESPDWLKKRLEVMGSPSINSIVDVTNYVMLELGQPMHAFDADAIAGAQIVLRPAKSGEEVATLDDKKATLHGGELLVADVQKPLAIAGVIGGKSSAISDKTKNVFFESASFSAHSIRRTARQHGIQTDSAYRFSRGVDPELTMVALKRAVQLLTKIYGEQKFKIGSLKQVGSQKHTPIQVTITMDFLSSKLGYPADAKKFEQFLKGIGCQFKAEGEKYVIVPPSFRFDLEQSVDFVEEYARLNGYENIPETLPRLDYAPSTMDPVYRNQKNLEEVFLGFGFHQAFHFAFADEKKENEHWGSWQKNLLIPPTVRGPVVLKNPLSADMGTLRRSLFSGMFESARHNLAQVNVAGGLFEIGKVFGALDEDSYFERTHAAALEWGIPDSFWNHAKYSPLEKIKESLYGVLSRFQVAKFEVKNFNSPDDVPGVFHPYRAGVVLVQRKVIAVFGEVHPQLLESVKIRVPVAYVEWNFDELQSVMRSDLRVSGLPKIPPVQKDIAFIVSKDVAVGDLIAEMKQAAGPAMTEVQVFDVFEDAQLGQNKWSLAFRYKLQSPEQTWVDGDLLKIQAQIIENLGKKFDCRLR